MGSDLASVLTIGLVGPDGKTKATTPVTVQAAVYPQAPNGPAGSALVVFPTPVALPAVLAGPIVRKTTTREVCIWICLSNPSRVDLSIYVDPGQPAIMTATTSTMPFGAYLHVALMRAGVDTSGGGLPEDTLIYYDMKFTATENPFLGEVAFHQSELTYGGAPFPAFVIASEKAPIILLQGSCRRIHSPGADAMKSADQYFAANADASKRPQQFLLTGDQIYADDLAPEVLALGKTLGKLLIGFDEVIPIRRHSNEPASTIAPGPEGFNRGGLVRSEGFTSDADSCVAHAMSFAEYVTLYLLAWSNDVWTFAKTNFAFLTGGGSLPDFKLTPAEAQRVMANVPTYMMCDDHEVTDDWNIDAKFRQNSTNSLLLRRILLNALSAYWLFQAWGNDPKTFGFFAPDLMERIRTSSPLDQYDLEDNIINHHVWAFVTPAPARVIMMDTRTRRVLHSYPNGPGLMNQGALSELGSFVADTPADRPVIIASPPPVFGFQGMEALQGAAGAMSESLFYQLDYEFWGADANCFLSFLKTVSDHAPTRYDGNRKRNVARIVIFAGDVHYSYTTSVGYIVDQPKVNPNFVEALHFTSSGIKNRVIDTKDGTRVMGVAKTFNESQQDIKGVWKDGVFFQSSEPTYTDPGTAAMESLLMRSQESKINVRIWCSGQAMSGQAVVNQNSVGVFIFQRPSTPQGDATVTCIALSTGGQFTTHGTWSSLMTGVQI